MAKRALGPALLRLVAAVEASVTDDDRTLLVACSGGADSLALAAATSHVARRTDRDVVAVVVDHQLQPGSDDVARRAAGQLRELGIAAVDIVAVDVPPGERGGPEAAARGARYEALRQAADRHDRATILLGHTLDDQAETVLLGLARGSGVRSLAAMAPRNGRLLRPLLDVPRAVTMSVCAELGLTPWHDPHNDDPRYGRVRVRHRVLEVLETELGPGIAAALARTAALARADADLLDRLAAEELGRCRTVSGGLDCRAAASRPDALRTRLLRRWLLDQGATEVSHRQLSAVDALLTDWRGQGPVELPALTVNRHAEELNSCGRLGARG